MPHNKMDRVGLHSQSKCHRYQALVDELLPPLRLHDNGSPPTQPHGVLGGQALPPISPRLSRKQGSRQQQSHTALPVLSPATLWVKIGACGTVSTPRWRPRIREFLPLQRC